MKDEYFRRGSEDFKKGFTTAETVYLEIIENEKNLKAFVEGYKQGYKDGMEASNKAIQRQIEKLAVDEEGVQPFSWPRWP